MGTAQIVKCLVAATCLLALGACSSHQSSSASPTAPADPGAHPMNQHYAIAIHGGAGVIEKTATPEERESYIASLTKALREGQERLARGDAALDVVEAVVRILEDDPNFNAGKGAVFTAEGTHELDASIMNGANLACGAVAGVQTVKNPISLARLVMEKTPHVMLAAEGAEQFASAMNVERVDPSYFDTPRRLKGLENWRREQEEKAKEAQNPEKPRGTAGCVVLDRHGNLAAATSTGGMTGKRFGRVGDSPVIGAGTYASNETCAVSCTGTGEEFIRHAAAFQVSAIMRYTGASVERAAHTVIFERLKADDGGLIAVSKKGEIAMPYSTLGMFRGAADSTGRFEVKIWE